MSAVDGAVAVVTGASGGVGGAIADALESAGARVARVSRHADEFRCDIALRDEVDRLKAEVETELGRPQVLVNAAGIFGPIALLSESEPERWIETIMVDLIGPYLTCRAFVPAMIDAGWGRIVNVTSAASLHPPGPTNSAYGTAKTALNQLTRHLAAELEGTGVTANVIHPGDVKTEMWADIRSQIAGSGPETEAYREWVEWVEETGGDPPEKAGDLVLRICEDDVNGKFLWIEDPLQAPIPSWGDEAGTQPWRR